MEKAYGREIQGLKNLLNEATTNSELYDCDYIDEDNIDVDGLWKPVLERAVDPHRKVGLDKIQILLDHWYNSMPPDDKQEGMTWDDITAIRDAHIARQEKEKADWEAKQEEMMKIIKAQNKRSTDDESSYNWLEPDGDEPQAWAGSIDISKYMFVDDDLLKIENDKYYKKNIRFLRRSF